MDVMFEINNLTVQIEEKSVLTDLSLTINPGTIHALMGPNGSGKSSLAYTLMGHPAYIITNGTLVYKGTDITHLAADKRSKLGIFLSFQHPYEIPGLRVFTFLKEIYQAHISAPIDITAFKTLLESYMSVLAIDKIFLERSLNEGFSGGEKKRLEMLQLLLLNPSFVILDEIDSGLDVDALKLVAQALHVARQNNPAMAILIITHYQRILDYIVPDMVHILAHAQLVKSGPAELAYQIEKKGYDEFCIR